MGFGANAEYISLPEKPGEMEGGGGNKTGQYEL